MSSSHDSPCPMPSNDTIVDLTSDAILDTEAIDAAIRDGRAIPVFQDRLGPNATASEIAEQTRVMFEQARAARARAQGKKAWDPTDSALAAVNKGQKRKGEDDYDTTGKRCKAKAEPHDQPGSDTDPAMPSLSPPTLPSTALAERASAYTMKYCEKDAYGQPLRIDIDMLATNAHPANRGLT